MYVHMYVCAYVMFVLFVCVYPHVHVCSENASVKCIQSCGYSTLLYVLETLWYVRTHLCVSVQCGIPLMKMNYLSSELSN